jgi:acid phosphatase
LGILLGDAVPADLVGTADKNFYNHYSEIASVAANWDLKTLGRWDVGANVWKLVADVTGDVIRPWQGTVPLEQRFFNQSYGGVFNNKPLNSTYPKPNLCIKRGGRSVAPVVGETWRGSKNPNYYEDKIEVPDGLNPPAGFAPQ